MSKSTPRLVYGLTGIDVLSEDVYHYGLRETATVAKTKSPGTPGLIILCTWMFADIRHISKYTTMYRTLYPHARLLILLTGAFPMRGQHIPRQEQKLKPAVSVIEDYLKSDTTDPFIALALFSNGGHSTAMRLADTYKNNVHPDSGLPHELPVGAIIFDSCPSIPRMLGTFQAGFMTAAHHGIPPLIAPLAAMGAFVIIETAAALGIVERTVRRAWAVVNDPSGPFLRPDIPRTYICSAPDSLIPIEDVRIHARQARHRLKEIFPMADPEIVSVVEMQDSGHVMHLFKDRERYISAVRKTLERPRMPQPLQAKL